MLIIVVLASLLNLLQAFRAAVEGYEDATGFHVGVSSLEVLRSHQPPATGWGGSLGT